MANQTAPPQSQKHQPGVESEMHPQPVIIRDDYRGSGKLRDRVTFITGGDSGIGRAVAVHCAREGANVAIAYLEENEDARETRRFVEAEGQRCLLYKGDLGEQATCESAIAAVCEEFGSLDVLINNAAEQHTVDKPEELTPQQIQRTFQTNVFAYFYTIQAALRHLKQGSSIINTASITGERGHKELIDYAATKGAILAMTFSFARALAERGIRVNAVAPGPIWTPLIPASFSKEKVARFGSDTLFKRPGQPSEVAPAYVFLASEDASFLTGEVINVNGGAHMAV